MCFLSLVQFDYEEKYIDDPSNEVWAEMYKVDIPVIHINGRYLMKHRVNEQLLRRTLEEGRGAVGSKMEVDDLYPPS